MQFCILPFNPTFYVFQCPRHEQKTPQKATFSKVAAQGCELQLLHIQQYFGFEILYQYVFLPKFLSFIKNCAKNTFGTQIDHFLYKGMKSTSFRRLAILSTFNSLQKYPRKKLSYQSFRDIFKEKSIENYGDTFQSTNFHQNHYDTDFWDVRILDISYHFLIFATKFGYLD